MERRYVRLFSYSLRHHSFLESSHGDTEGIKYTETGAPRACVEADLPNEKTVYQKTIAWTIAAVIGSGLAASTATSVFGHSYTATHVLSNALSLFSYFQNEAYFGMTAVE